jgi:hypothetical protein
MLNTAPQQESFTLKIAWHSDFFAQVQVTMYFLNLSPFEVGFRIFVLFFTEGTELFNKVGCYSRQIGAEPSGTRQVSKFCPSNNPQYSIRKKNQE